MKRFFSRLGIGFTAQALLYPLFLVGAFVFAQTLKKPVSHMILWVVILLPVITVLQLVILRAFIRVNFQVQQCITQKYSPVKMDACILSRSIFPASMAEVCLMLPDDVGDKCVPHRFVMSLLPFSSVRIEKAVEFAFCGEYTVGVTELYVYDFFRAVKLRIPCDQKQNITVLPRIFDMPVRLSAYASACGVLTEQSGENEVSGVRNYQNGDALKHIHWKLTSKSEETLVKEYVGNGGGTACILCDLSSPSGDEKNALSDFSGIADRVCLDLVIEAALSAVKRELDICGEAILAWVDDGTPEILRINSADDLDRAVLRICAIKNDETQGQLSLLRDALKPAPDTAVIAVSPFLDPPHTNEYLSLVCGAAYDTADGEYIYCRDSAVLPQKNSSDTENGAAATLEFHGIRVIRAAEFIKNKHLQNERGH